MAPQAFGQPYLADFLAVVLRYAPPGLTVGLATRAPLPVNPESARHGWRLVRAADLAFTPEEAAGLLGRLLRRLRRAAAGPLHVAATGGRLAGGNCRQRPGCDAAARIA